MKKLSIISLTIITISFCITFFLHSHTTAADNSYLICKDWYTVEIDIKPGSLTNPVNPKSRGMLPVAILGSNEDEDLGFDVSNIDPYSIYLKGLYCPAYPVRWNIKDVNGDNIPDYFFLFEADFFFDMSCYFPDKAGVVLNGIEDDLDDFYPVALVGGGYSPEGGSFCIWGSDIIKIVPSKNK